MSSFGFGGGVFGGMVGWAGGWCVLRVCVFVFVCVCVCVFFFCGGEWGGICVGRGRGRRGGKVWGNAVLRATRKRKVSEGGLWRGMDGYGKVVRGNRECVDVVSYGRSGCLVEVVRGAVVMWEWGRGVRGGGGRVRVGVSRCGGRRGAWGTFVCAGRSGGVGVCCEG